jgi:hypothetical protein
MYEVMTNEDLRCILQGLIDRAKAGDAIATREVLDRMIGRPVQAIALDAHIGLNAGNELGPEDFSGPTGMQRLAHLYAELGVPLQNWPFMVRAHYENWVLDENHPARPDDLPQLVAVVRQKCEGWQQSAAGEISKPKS